MKSYLQSTPKKKRLTRKSFGMAASNRASSPVTRRFSFDARLKLSSTPFEHGTGFEWLGHLLPELTPTLKRHSFAPVSMRRFSRDLQSGAALNFHAPLVPDFSYTFCVQPPLPPNH